MGSIRKRRDRHKPYLARYRGPDGRERTKAFARKIDAQRWLVERERDKNRGEWIDPALGRITFGDWVAEVEATRLNRRGSSRARDASLLRSVIIPALGDRPLAAIEPVEIRQGIAAISQQGYASSTIAKAYQIVARAFRVAATDGPPFLTDELATHIGAFSSVSDLIFSMPQGGPLDYNRFRTRYWNPAVTQSAGQPCTPHDLRHTHVALLIAQGESPKYIADRLGHESTRTVLDVYGHLYEDADDAVVDRLEEVRRR